MRYCIPFSILLSFSTPLCAQQSHAHDTVTTIKTTSGAIYLGKIVRETSDSIYFQSDDGASMQLPRGSVTSIDYKSIKPPTHWSEFGGVLGTPAGLNVVVGAHWPQIGIRLSGAYWGHSISGIQIGVPINISRSENASHDIAIVGCTSFLELQSTSTNSFYGSTTIAEGHYWTGAGVAYELNISGFSLELGLTIGSGTFSSPQAVFQIGYVHQNK